MGTKVAVLCLKWGEAYGAGYVNTLYNAVAANISGPFDFICVTDDPTGIKDGVTCVDLDFSIMPREDWPNGMWPKVKMFDASLVGGYDVILFLDLDIVITGSLDPLIRKVAKDQRLYLIPKFRGFLWRKIPMAFWDIFPAAMNYVTWGNSSVVCFAPRNQTHLFDEFDPETVPKLYKNDQDYISDRACRRRYFSRRWCAELRLLVPRWPLNRIIHSYRHKPRQSKIVIFNGFPKPREVISPDTGEWGSRHRRGSGPLTWVAEYFDKFDE